VSAWVKPSAPGGVVVSQDMTHAASFKIYPDTSSGKWFFCMATADTATATYNCASGGSVNLALWTHLTATYQAATGVMNLYATGVNIATLSHTALTGTTTGPLQIGDYLYSNVHTSYFNGQVADVQAWNQVASPAQAQTPAGYYQPITPTRFLDTRNGTGGTTGPVAGGGTVRLQIAGAHGIPATNVTAVAVNVTVTAETASGVVTVYPEDTPQPLTTNLNYVAATGIANLVIVPVGADGYIDLYHTSGPVQLIGDVSGYFTSDVTKGGDTTFTPMTPTRVLDTRNGTGAPKAKIGEAGSVALQIGGANGIPTGVSAVAINITAVNETSGGYLTDYADGTSRPATSNLSFSTLPVAEMAIVPVGADGKIDIWEGGSTGTIDVVGDVSGYFTAGTAGEKYHAIGATRMIDTRQDSQPVPSGGTLTVAQGGTVIALNPTLVLNVTAVNGAASGVLTVYPDGTSIPGTSNVNYTASEVIPNLALAATGGGTTDVYNNSSGTVQVVVDCYGYFSSG